MGLRINNNITAVNGHRNMLKNDMAISSSLEKLSSGLKINRAADDAAGLIISEQMRSQLAGLNQAIDNTDTAIAMVQTAEGALDEMNSLLNKARELALHAANDGANDSNQLAADQSELDNIVSSIDRIANNTQFGTKKILDGTLSASQVNDAASISSFSSSGLSNGNYDVTVGTAGVRAAYSSTDNATLTTASATSVFDAASSTAVDANSTFDVETTVSIQDASTNILASVTVTAGSTLADAIAALNQDAGSKDVGISAAIGATGQFNLTAEDIGTYANGATLNFNNGTNHSLQESLGVNVAGVNAQLTLATTLGNEFDTQALAQTNRGSTFNLTDTTDSTQSAFVTLSDAAITAAPGTYTDAVGVTSGATFQIGANQNQTASVSIQSMAAENLGIEGGDDLQDLVSGQYLVNGRAQEAIGIIDAAIDEVTNVRGELGAFQSNTLQTNVNSLRVSMENLTAAESTIRDVDFAKESAEFTRSNILIQANTSMLAQANQLPNNVLQLLG
jgi:flagellin